MDNPRVSVICIFYDEERFLAEALDSVLAQDFTDWELLLVDDGSRDESAAIAREYAQRDPARIRYLAHPGLANRGMSAARNLGVAHANGEFIAFIDADDRWRTAKLREQVALLEDHPQAAMVCGAVNYWSSWQGGDDRRVQTGRTGDSLSYPPATSLMLYPLGNAGAPCPSDAILRAEALRQLGGFDETFTGMYEDQVFYGKLYLAYPVWFSSRVWLDYRQHDASSVAASHRGGMYPEVRRGFLHWFRRHVLASGANGADRIVRSIDRALWKLDHPVAGRLLRRISRLAS